MSLDTFAGPVHVEWDTEAALTPLGQLPFFIDFLKSGDLFDAFVSECPLHYTSPNAPKKRDVLGTAMLSMLSGHKRYAHIAALRCDSVLPELLGMNKIVSEDAVRRAFAAIDEDEGAAWLRRHLDYCTTPLLAEPWILDIDTTVKPLYGHQEGAVVGYNPKKPGRPSHSYHTYSMAGTRLIFDVDVVAGNEHTSKHFAPGLWALLDRIPRDLWPALLRGDCGFGNEAIMREAEQRGLAYLFKLRLTANVKRMIERLSTQRAWVNAGHGWQAKESLLRLDGWSRQRRVIILRRRVKGGLAISSNEPLGQQTLSFVEVSAGVDVYEYSVLATLLDEELVSFGQLYRDRGDSENIFDELKNQWGWGGFVTHDLARCRLSARMVALFYNWWNIFVRLVEPDRHMEAITSRPLLLHAIATRVRHARQTTITVASSHAKAIPAAKAFRAVANFLRDLTKSAEQLTGLQCWRRILARAFHLETAVGWFGFSTNRCIIRGMTHDVSHPCLHPTGEQPPVEENGPPQGVSLDTFAGPVHVEWDTEAALTPLGQLPFFIDFLKSGDLFDAFVSECPLHYTSPNAPKKRDVLGTAMLSMLSGHKRYAHIAALRCDSVLPELLGMNKIVSEDAVRRAFAAIDEDEGAAWLRRHLDYCTTPLLAEPWILDIDTTVKPLYGHQEGAVVGYNPKKPGRPSHSYHTYSMAGTRLIFDVDVVAGNEHTSKHFAPGLWALLDRIPRDLWPALLRGDCGFGNEAIMREAEQRGLAYLFKLRLTANVKRMIERLSTQRAWVNAGHGWQAKESLLRLDGWSRQRRVIILRRRVKGGLAISSNEPLGQQTLSFVEVSAGVDVYEYSVLATLLDEELVSFGQLYRDRGDSENIFDELKNQWGWGGFVTHDLARCRLSARMVALFYNWWNIFVRLVEPDRHMEAITSRPLLLHAIATRVRHARQTTITVASSHAKAIPAAKAFRAVANFLRDLTKSAEQLTGLQCWRRILARAFQVFLQGRQLRSPPRLAPS